MLKRIKSLLFENRSTKQTVAKNVFWIATSQFAGRFIRAFFVVYAARILGAAGYGIFSYILGLSAFFTLFGDLGIAPVTTREISKNPESGNIYFGTAFVVKVVLSLFAATLLVFATPFFSNVREANTLLIFAGLLVIIDNLREFCSSYFRAHERMELEAAIVIITNIVITIGGFIALFYFPELKPLMGIYAAGSTLGMLVAFYFVWKPLMEGIRRFNFSLLKPMLVAAIPFSLTGILGGLLLNTDMMVLGWMQTAREIGLYSAGQKIVFILYTIPAIFVGGLFPPMTRFIAAKNNSAIRTILEKGTGILLAIAIPLVVGAIVLAQPIFQFVFGTEYLPGILSFQLLAITILVVFPTTLYATFLFASNRQNTMAALSAFMAIGNFIFDILFIRWWGFVGSSVATLVMQIIYWFLVVRLVKKHAQFSIGRKLKNVFLATCIMVFLILTFSWLRLPLLLIIFLGAVGYFSILFLKKEPLLFEVITLLRGARSSKPQPESQF